MAIAAEEVGFDGIYVGDHLLYRGDGRPERGPWSSWSHIRELGDAGADEVIVVVSPITERSIRMLGEAVAHV